MTVKSGLLKKEQEKPPKLVYFFLTVFNYCER